MMLIENGMVIDPANGIKKQASILIKEGKIAKIIENQQELDALQINSCDRINALGCIVAPGLVDVHVHFRDPGFTHKEDIETGAKAALRGGFTSVVLMANTNPVVDNAETLTYVLEKGKKTDLKVYTCATVTKGMSGKELTDMELLFAKGAVVGAVKG